MRVVFDTNILVSFAIGPSSVFEKIFDLVAETGLPLASEATIAELFIVLRRDKFRKYISLESAVDYVEWYAGISETVEIVEIVENVFACRDQRDDKFLEVAINGKADLIVSGDEDLLSLNPFRSIRIVTPAAFLEKMVS